MVRFDEVFLLKYYYQIILGMDIHNLHHYRLLRGCTFDGFILFTALEILLRSSERMLEGFPQIRVTTQELVILGLVLGFNLLLAGYEYSEGRRLNNSLLKADAQHAASDVWTTVVVLVGMAGAMIFKVNWLDIAHFGLFTIGEFGNVRNLEGIEQYRKHNEG